MIIFSLRQLTLLAAIDFSYTERLASTKIEKDLSLQRNENEVNLLLIYHNFIKINFIKYIRRAKKFIFIW